MVAGAVLLAVAVVVFLGFVSPGWFNQGTVDSTATEDDVLAAIPPALADPVGVYCPEDEPETGGHSFTCTVMWTDNAKRVRVTVPVDEDHPYVVVIPGDRVLDRGGVEQGVVQIHGQGGTKVENVSCPDDIKVEKNATGDCTATVNGEQKTIKITVVDAESDPPKYEVGQPQ